MSSWANIRVPKKRNLSQIPEELRPTIIPRVARPEVLISESFQEVSQNEIIMNTRSSEPRKAVEPPVNPRQYITKKIDLIPNPSAFELRFRNKSYIFVILRHLRNVRDNDLWISSYNSIRKFYTNKIVIIDDNSAVNTVDGKLINTEVIKSDFNGAGEILPYYYFLKYKWADNMIFLHDSMFINRPFRDTELEGTIRFHWHFEKGEFADMRKINMYMSVINNGTKLKEFIANPENVWRGCFGCTSICDLTTLETLEMEYNFINNLVLSIKTRKDRESFERLFGIILYYSGMADKNISNFGNIFNYPEHFNDKINMETFVNIIRQHGYDTAIIKVWRGR